ncbi:MAG: tripartite tricarboxylate transporter TctB family protein [Opitutaceae bacterium]|nr:tripartite tricarboxylate transporter TctB family protein [Opitutaceae bacterium]
MSDISANDTEAESNLEAESSINKEQLVEAIAIGAFSLTLLGVTFTFREVPEILAQGIGPAVFPRAVLLLMLILSVILGVRAVRPARSGEVRKAMKPIPRIAYISAGMLFLFAVGLLTIGTFPSLLIFCFALSLIWGERRYLPMTITFILFAVAVYVLFEIALGTNLP